VIAYGFFCAVDGTRPGVLKGENEYLKKAMQKKKHQTKTS
jgi:hypothetical protein